MAYPQMIVQLYKGLMKVYTNQSCIYEGSIAVMEHKEKDQVAGLEIAESFILCSHQAFKTNIKKIAVSMHNDDQGEVAQGQFTDNGGDIDITRLESGISFLRQVRNAICVNWREIAHMRLKAIAGKDNPYCLIMIFGSGPPRLKRRSSIRYKMCSGGGHPLITQELHRGDTCTL
jgi:hypothetical protein